MSAQDVYYGGLEEVKIWTNPALKVNQESVFHIHFRAVNYPERTKYASKNATLELTFGGSEEERDNQPFVSMALGINADAAPNGFMKVSSAMMSFAYALPLNYDNTYLSAGLQGTYIFSQVGSDLINFFPADFDLFGPIRNAALADPYGSGYSFGFLNAGAGVTVFHSGVEKQWYIGASVRHFNHPYTEYSRSQRLPEIKGIQAGYAALLNTRARIAGYATYSVQKGLQAYNCGGTFGHAFGDSSMIWITGGLGYRYRDAIIPSVRLRFQKNELAFYYELALPVKRLMYYPHSAFEFSYAIQL